MTRMLLSLILLSWLALPLSAQSVTLPSEVKGSPGSWIIVAPEKIDGGKVRWRVDPALQDVRLDLLFPPDVIDKLRGKVVTSSKPGRYRIEAWNAKGDVASDIAVCWVVVDGGPVPPPPPPPIPPVPPDPDPKPSPAPIPFPGFRALIIYETSELGKLPQGQLDVLYGIEVRSYLARRCVKGPNGTTPEWRLWDKDADTSGESKLWQDAMKRTRASVPWLILSDGKIGFEGPLPSSIPEMMTLLKKYGGE